ncbi:hypothetical protein GCM10023162_06070 [Klenkia terrae]
MIEVHGRRVPLPPAAVTALAAVCELLATGSAVTAIATAPMVTTEVAARLLGVSRPTVVRMLDAGCLPYQRLASHRRLHLSDVLAFRDSRRCLAADRPGHAYPLHGHLARFLEPATGHQPPPDSPRTPGPRPERDGSGPRRRTTAVARSPQHPPSPAATAPAGTTLGARKVQG